MRRLSMELQDKETVMIIQPLCPGLYSLASSGSYLPSATD